MSFRINKTIREQEVELGFSGGLDMGSIKGLDGYGKELAGFKKVIINLGELEFIDSVGVERFLKFVENLIDREKIVRIRNMTPEIKDIFELIGIYGYVGHEVFEL